MEDRLQEKLRDIRKLHGMSQDDVAKHICVSRQAVSQWETGKTKPDVDVLKKLCELYGVSMDELLEISGSPKVTKKDMRDIVEVLILTIVLALASQLPIVGVLLSLAVVVFAFKRNVKAKKVVILVAMIAFVISGQHTYDLLLKCLDPNAERILITVTIKKI